MSEPIGQPFGSYVLESLIGRGPNGRVYRARQVRLNRPAAVKLLDTRFAGAPDFARRLQTAMQRVAGLRGANIADIEDFGDQNGLGYIAMELYDEGSLRTFLQQRTRGRDPWNIAQVLGLVRQAAEGLQAAHAAGFVHGHMKPENILLQKRGQDAQRARIGDFGLLELAGNAPITSFTYTTPEQARGEAPTPQSDIYALGIVLYEVATGYVPFAVKTAEEAAAKHGNAQPVPPRRVRAELPAELEQVILRCLAKRPEQRFTSAAEVAQALERVISTTSAGQTVLLSDLPTQALAQPPQQTTQILPIDPSEQPTVRAQIDPSQQPTVRASNGPKVELLDAQGNVRRSIDLTGAGLTIGRAQENGLVLDNEQVSRHHARIDWDGRQTTLTDLGAANGTQLNGMRLPPNVPVPWNPGQQAQIGPFVLQVVAPLGIPAAPQPGGDPLLQGLLNTNAPNASAPTEAFNVQASGAQLGIQLDQEQLTITPSQRETLNLTLLNNGTRPDSVTVSVEGAPGMWVGMPQQAVQIPPGGRAPLALSISVPRESESLAGDYPVIIRARSSANPGESATARGRWTVLPFAASSLSISPRRAGGRRDASFQVTLRNDGNQPATFLLGADDQAQELRYNFSDESITLQPGEAETIGLNVAVRSRLIGGADAIPFHVSARAADERPSTATAQFVSEALMPPALPIILLALVGVGVLYFILNGANLGGIGTAPTATGGPTATVTATATPEPGAPAIAEFVLDPPVVQPGQNVVIRWNVNGADSVDLQAGDAPIATNLPPQGQQSYAVNQTTNITLIARGGGKQTIQTIPITIATPVPATEVPTNAPTELPTVVPTTVPPTAPPAPTAVPPTAAPTAVPPTNVPLPTLPPVQNIDMVAAAETATWSNNNAQEVEFGKPSETPENGGWAEVQTAARIEGGGLIPSLQPLYTVPLSGTGGFIVGAYQVPNVGQGQKFLADIGFANGTQNAKVKVQLLYSGEIIFEQEKQADGKLLNVAVDLANFVGTAGTLQLRVENVDNPANTGLYWVKPRVADR